MVSNLTADMTLTCKTEGWVGQDNLCKGEHILSYDVAVIQRITSCHKTQMTTHVIHVTLWCVYITSLTTSVSTMSFLIEIMLILKAIKSLF